MPTKLVVRTDGNWTGQDNEDQKCFSCVVVRFGEHVIDVVCSKQDVVSLSAPESEFYAMSSGGIHGIDTKNIFSDLQIDVSVRLETDSTSACGFCRHRGVGRLRHLQKKELWLQDQVAAKNIEMGRVPSEDNEADLSTKYLERDRIKKCETKMGMLFTGAWAGEQLPVLSGTEVLSGEDLIEGQSWTMGVVLLVTVGVELLSCATALFYPHLPTGNVQVTREPAIARQWKCMSPRAMQDDDFDHLIVTLRDVDSLTVFWKSAGGQLVQFLRHVAIMSENQTDVCCRLPWVCRLDCKWR